MHVYEGGVVRAAGQLASAIAHTGAQLATDIPVGLGGS